MKLWNVSKICIPRYIACTLPMFPKYEIRQICFVVSGVNLFLLFLFRFVGLFSASEATEQFPVTTFLPRKTKLLKNTCLSGWKTGLLSLSLLFFCSQLLNFQEWFVPHCFSSLYRLPDLFHVVLVHCTGYLKSWPPAGSTFDDDEDNGDSSNLSCLVAVCRQQKIYDEETDYTQPGVAHEFVTRHSIDGKFIFVDQRWAQPPLHRGLSLNRTNGKDSRVRMRTNFLSITCCAIKHKEIR